MPSVMRWQRGLSRPARSASSDGPTDHYHQRRRLLSPQASPARQASSPGNPASEGEAHGGVSLPPSRAAGAAVSAPMAAGLGKGALPLGMGRGKPQLPPPASRALSEISIITGERGVDEVVAIGNFDAKVVEVALRKVLPTYEYMNFRSRSLLEPGGDVSLGVHTALGGWPSYLPPGRDRGAVTDLPAYAMTVLDHMCQASLPDTNSISMWVGVGDTHALDMYIVTAFGGAARLLAQPPSNAYAFSLEDRLFSLLSPEYVAFKHLLVIGVHACTESPFDGWRAHGLPFDMLIEAYDAGLQSFREKWPGRYVAPKAPLIPAAELQACLSYRSAIEGGVLGICVNTGAFSLTALLADAFRGTDIMAAMLLSFDNLRHRGAADVAEALDAAEPFFSLDPPQWNPLTKPPGHLPGFGVPLPARPLSWQVQRFFREMAERARIATGETADWPVLNRCV